MIQLTMNQRGPRTGAPMFRFNSVVIGTTLILLVSGCFVPRSQGDQMQADIDRLKSEIAALQRDRSDMQHQVGSRLQSLESSSFKRNADSGATQDRLLAEVQQLRGQLEETQHRLDESQATTVKAVTQPASKELPLGKNELFAKAKQLYDSKKYDAAVDAFDGFLEDYKDDKELARDAYFMRGDAYFMRAKSAAKNSLKKDLYKKAVLSFQDVLTRYPTYKRVPETLYKIGQSLEAMGYPKDARVFYDEIVQKHPKSTFAKDASKKKRK